MILSGNKGKEFEEYVHRIYDMMLNMNIDSEEEVIVSKNVRIKKNNYTHEFDVYYEFTKAGILHRVGIECKNTNAPIEKGQVQEFESKIRDLQNVIGVIISVNGFQQGARAFAKDKGIIALDLKDLPNIMQLIGIQLSKVYLPNPKQRGEPFFVLMEVNEHDELTGNYEIVKQNGKNLILLFISKKHAQDYIFRKKIKDIQPRALKQESFELVIRMASLQKANFGIIVIPRDAEAGDYMCLEIMPEILRKEYYYV